MELSNLQGEKSSPGNNSNSSSLCLFHAIWLAGEKVLQFDKFYEQESRNYFPSAGSKANEKR